MSTNIFIFITIALFIALLMFNWALKSINEDKSGGEKYMDTGKVVTTVTKEELEEVKKLFIKLRNYDSVIEQIIDNRADTEAEKQKWWDKIQTEYGIDDKELRIDTNTGEIRELIKK